MASFERDAYVGLGSNLGDRRGHLQAALRALAETPGLRVEARSRLYETAPVGGPPQGPFLNAVARLRTALGAQPLLERLLAIERGRGRARGPERFAPRTLDLDLLLYGDETHHGPGLVVPHPRLHERGFVLEPLRELAPELVHPVLGQTIDVLAAQVRDPAAVRVFDQGEGVWPSPQ